MSRGFEIPGETRLLDEENQNQLQRSEMALLDKLNFVLGKQFQTCFLYGSN
jgi:hypothetical protein